MNESRKNVHEILHKSMLSQKPESRTDSEAAVAGLFDESSVKSASAGSGFHRFQVAAFIGGFRRSDLCKYSYPRFAN